MQQPPPALDIEDLEVGRDLEAEEAFFDTFKAAEGEFLARTDPEKQRFTQTLDQLDPALANVSAALRGSIPTSQLGLATTATEENLQQESGALQSIEEQLAASNAGASFFGQRLLGDTKTKFAQDRSRIVPDLIRDIIANQSGLAGQASQGRLADLGVRTGIVSDAAAFSQGFNAPSRIKTQNIAEVARQSAGGTVQTSSSGGKGGGVGAAVGSIGAALVGAAI